MLYFRLLKNSLCATYTYNENINTITRCGTVKIIYFKRKNNKNRRLPVARNREASSSEPRRRQLPSAVSFRSIAAAEAFVGPWRLSERTGWTTPAVGWWEIAAERSAR